MWTLILIISFSSGSRNASYAGAAINHIDGFHTESSCVEASRKIARERKDSSLRMYCVRTDERSIR